MVPSGYVLRAIRKVTVESISIHDNHDLMPTLLPSHFLVVSPEG